MKTVSAELKARVNARIEQCRALAQAAYPTRTIPTPEIRYDINSARIGGQAHTDRYIRLNPVFLNSQTDHYLIQTVGHEFAHIATYAVHGRVQAHGFQWKTMMSVLGIPADRCHSYEVPEGVAVGKPKQKFGYHCAACNEPVPVGPKVHKSIQRGKTYWHKPCGRHVGTLVYAGAVGKVSRGEARKLTAAMTPAVAEPPAITVLPGITIVRNHTKPASKIAVCQDIYDRFSHSSDRATLIQMFIKRAGCTPAGAATYYHTLSNKKG